MQEPIIPIEIDVNITVTLTKTVKIKVNDYEELETEYWGITDYDFSECNIKEAVERQIPLPQEAIDGWDVEEFNVELA